MPDALEFLRQSQHPDGGWGYRADAAGMSFVEPTAAALQVVKDENARGRGRDWLLSIQRPDGGWGIAAVDGESGWMTAWAVLALVQFPPAQPAVARGVAWLIETDGLRVADAASRAVIHQRLNIDSSLRGWPWQPGDAAWVHPTALAILALCAAGYSDHARVRDGLDYLFDRADAQGGWNIGNPEMLGKAVPATIQDTAVALLALRAAGAERANPQVAASMEYLRDASASAKTAAELAWAIYALRRWNQDAASAQALLQTLQLGDGSWQSNPFVTAAVLIGQA